MIPRRDGMVLVVLSHIITKTDIWGLVFLGLKVVDPQVHLG